MASDLMTFESVEDLNAAIDNAQTEQKVVFVRQTSTKNFGCDGVYCCSLGCTMNR